MAERLRVAVVFGGSSVEHEVSVVSARSVASGLESAGMDVVPVGVTERGAWLTPGESEPILRGTAARVEGTGADGRVLIDPGAGGLATSNAGGTFRPLDVDVVFPLIHGWGGEDGRIQGLLELAGVPYVGSGVFGSAAGMDKEASKSIFEFRGLPVGPWVSFRAGEYRADPRAWERRAVEIGLPVFVKPANGGSSVGVSRVEDPAGLPEAIDEALECDAKVVVEAAVDAREIECAVLGNDTPEASVLGEIVPSREFYDYTAKYEDESSELIVPASLSRETTQTVRRLSVEAFRVLDLSGLARVDWLVERSTERPFLNEVNTLPGFTPISMFPKLWEASGVAYPALLEKLVRLGLDQSARRRSRRTRRG